MKRCAANFASGVAVALLLAILALWIRSYSHCDVLIRQRGPNDRFGLTSEFGLIVLEFEPRRHNSVQQGWVYFAPSLPRRWRHSGGVLGFDFYSEPIRHYLLLPASRVWGLTVPHLFPAFLTSIPLAFWMARRRSAALHRTRLDSGLCVACGYDLRASTYQCPECGTIP